MGPLALGQAAAGYWKRMEGCCAGESAKELETWKTRGLVSLRILSAQEEGTVSAGRAAGMLQLQAPLEMGTPVARMARALALAAEPGTVLQSSSTLRVLPRMAGAPLETQLSATLWAAAAPSCI